MSKKAVARRQTAARPAETAARKRAKTVAGPKNFGGRPRRRRAPKSSDPAHYKSKATIAVSPEDLAWATNEAKLRNVSVSSVFQQALRALRRDKAWGIALTYLGTDDITEEDLKRVDEEWAAAGFNP